MGGVGHREGRIGGCYKRVEMSKTPKIFITGSSYQDIRDIIEKGRQSNCWREHIVCK